MPIYTVVDESFDVEVYTTLKAVSGRMADSELYVVQDDEDVQVEATPAAIRKALRNNGEALLSDDGGRDWKYKIQKH